MTAPPIFGKESYFFYYIQLEDCFYCARSDYADSLRYARWCDNSRWNACPSHEGVTSRSWVIHTCVTCLIHEGDTTLHAATHLHFTLSLQCVIWSWVVHIYSFICVIRRVGPCALQCVAVCCSVLQCVAVCCSVLHYVAVCDIYACNPARWSMWYHEWMRVYFDVCVLDTYITTPNLHV